MKKVLRYIARLLLRILGLALLPVCTIVFAAVMFVEIVVLHPLVWLFTGRWLGVESVLPVGRWCDWILSSTVKR